MSRWRGLRFVAILAILVAGCAEASVPPTALPATSTLEPATATPTPGADDALEALRGVMDPDGLALLALLDAPEWIEATIDLDHARGADGAARAAETAGLHADVVADGTVLVVGPRDEVLRFAAALRPTLVVLAEDHRVTRWLPSDRADVAVPVPGLPYAGRPFDPNTSTVRMDQERLQSLLGQLARTIVTIDGRPYERLTLDGGCDQADHGVICQLWAHGSSGGVVRGTDGTLVSLDPATGALRIEETDHWGVPRPLVRAAEWIARHDPEAGQVIATYEACCFARWDPARPGVIAVRWTRPCRDSVAPAGTAVAETGECDESMEAVVDVGRVTVLSVTELGGP